MDKQPDALRVADRCASLATIADAYSDEAYREAAAELRRQHALIAELVGALTECAGRLHVHMLHTEDLMAHMKATAALSKAKEQ